MAFIRNDSCKSAGIPLRVPQFCLPAIFCQKFCNLSERKSVQVQIVNHLHRLCFVLIHHKAAILVLVISEQSRRKEQSTAEPAVNGPVHNDRLGMRFFLCHGCQNRQDHAPVTVQCVDVVRFKFYTHGRVKIFQCFNDGKAVHNVSGETGDGLCEDQVNLSGLTVLDQLLHSLAMLQ